MAAAADGASPPPAPGPAPAEEPPTVLEVKLLSMPIGADAWAGELRRDLPVVSAGKSYSKVKVPELFLGALANLLVHRPDGADGGEEDAPPTANALEFRLLYGRQRPVGEATACFASDNMIDFAVRGLGTAHFCVLGSESRHLLPPGRRVALVCFRPL